MTTLEHESQVDFEAVGRKLQSAETLNEDEKFLVFGRATNFASDLIDSNLKETYATSPVSVEIRSHMTVVVLDRVVSLYQGGSTILFDGLKKAVCEAFSIQEENLSDGRLYSVLSSSLDEYFTREISDEVRKKMSYIRGVADQVVPSKT
jgi:hypothetical protein